MKNADVIRAWKDPEYRESLSESERALLPEHPAGLMELSNDLLQEVDGGTIPTPLTPASPLLIWSSMVCITLGLGGLSALASCNDCAETIYHGTCDFTSLGCVCS